jgi:hypothetical protein
VKKALVEEKINSKIDIMKGKSFLDKLEFVKYEGLYKEVEVDHQIYLVDNNESVTPTTDKGYLDVELVSKKLVEFKKEQDIELTKILLNATSEKGLFVKKYSYDADETDNSQVLRFGINTNQKGLIEELINYNKLFRESLSGNLEKMSNISGESNYGKFVSTITPTDVKTNIVKTAIHYLMNTDSKTVLVDVFPRVLDSKAEGTPVGTIKLSGNIETHTALLYNTGEKILVIDPNNPQFSAFLENVNPTHIQSSYRANDKIYTRAGESGLESWRDCIDIAVKLAFVLNASENNYKDVKGIIYSPEVKLITNKPVIDNKIFYSKNKVIREKQTSDFEKIILFNQNLEQKAELFNKQQDFLDKAKEQADQKLLNMFENALISHNDVTPIDFNKEIVECFLMGEDH